MRLLSVILLGVQLSSIVALPIAAKEESDNQRLDTLIDLLTEAIANGNVGATPVGAAPVETAPVKEVVGDAPAEEGEAGEAEVEEGAGRRTHSLILDSHTKVTLENEVEVEGVFGTAVALGVRTNSKTTSSKKLTLIA